MTHDKPRICDIKECFGEAQYKTTMTVSNPNLPTDIETEVLICEGHSEKFKNIVRDKSEIRG